MAVTDITLSALTEAIRKAFPDKDIFIDPVNAYGFSAIPEDNQFNEASLAGGITLVKPVPNRDHHMYHACMDDIPVWVGMVKPHARYIERVEVDIYMLTDWNGIRKLSGVEVYAVLPDEYLGKFESHPTKAQLTAQAAGRSIEQAEWLHAGGCISQDELNEAYDDYAEAEKELEAESDFYMDMQFGIA